MEEPSSCKSSALPRVLIDVDEASYRQENNQRACLPALRIIPVEQREMTADEIRFSGELQHIEYSPMKKPPSKRQCELLDPDFTQQPNKRRLQGSQQSQLSIHSSARTSPNDRSSIRSLPLFVPPSSSVSSSPRTSAALAPFPRSTTSSTSSSPSTTHASSKSPLASSMVPPRLSNRLESLSELLPHQLFGLHDGTTHSHRHSPQFASSSASPRRITHLRSPSMSPVSSLSSSSLHSHFSNSPSPLDRSFHWAPSPFQPISPSSQFSIPSPHSSSRSHTDSFNHLSGFSLLNPLRTNSQPHAELPSVASLCESPLLYDSTILPYTSYSAALHPRTYALPPSVTSSIASTEAYNQNHQVVLSSELGWLTLQFRSTNGEVIPLSVRANVQLQSIFDTYKQVVQTVLPVKFTVGGRDLNGVDSPRSLGLRDFAYIDVSSCFN
jgi:hypothetical protein